MKITFRQGGDNTLKCVNQLLDKMTLDVFNSLLKKEYVKPETDVYETLVDRLMNLGSPGVINVSGDPGGNTGDNPGGGGAGTPGQDGTDELEGGAKVADFEEEEEEDVLVWGLSWFKYMWQ